MKETLLLASVCLILGACSPGNTPLLETLNSEGIINGNVVKERKSTAAKSVVLLETLNPQGRSAGFCTATLIGSNILITAAHCFDDHSPTFSSKFRVRFGTNAFSNPGEVRLGLSYVTHPDFNTTKKFYDHDIAVAMFAGPLPEGFAPVAYETNKKAEFSRSVVYVYGYGRSVDYADNPHQAPWQFTGQLHRGVMKIDSYYSRFADRYWTDSKVPTFICQGDSGGPQFYHQKGVLKIIGINSGVFGPRLPEGKTGCKAMAQATKVAPFAPWIQKSITKLTTEFSETLPEHSDAFGAQALQQ